MIKLLIPLLLGILGTGAGVGVAFYLKQEEAAAQEAALQCPEPAPGDETSEIPEMDDDDVAGPDTREYVKLTNQFVVPVINDGGRSGLVVMSLGIEVRNGNTEIVYAHEPKLRDILLRVMFDHANAGGFDDEFTTPLRMKRLRDAFRNEVRGFLGDTVTDVLITEIVRQEG